MAEIITLVHVTQYGPKGFSAKDGCPFGISNFCISGEGDLFCKGILNPNKETYLTLKDIHKNGIHLLTCFAANRLKLSDKISNEELENV